MKQKTTDPLPTEKYKPVPNKGYQKNDPDINVGRFAYEMNGGVDLLQITGVGVGTVLMLMSETGFDLSKFPLQSTSPLGLDLLPIEKYREERSYPLIPEEKRIHWPKL